MKTVVLNSCEIALFKGISAGKFDFDGCSAAIYGANGSGKSSVADAWTWLLFGKNSAGASDFSVKPLNKGGSVLDHKARTSVEADITVDGERHSFRRVYFEKWSTKRGSPEPIFDGHTTEFYIDGLPKTKSEYDATISSIIAPEDVFILLSRLNAFCDSLSWQKRRQMLFELANVGTDADIMKSDERFIPLSNTVGKYPIDELRRKLMSDNKKLGDEIVSISGRMEEAANMARQMRVQSAEAAVKTINERQAKAACDLTALIEKRQNLRAQYSAFAEAPLKMGATVCRTCGSVLSEDAQRTAAEKERQLQLGAIADEGKRLSESITAAEQNISAIEAELSAAERELERVKLVDASEGDSIAAKRLEELQTQAKTNGERMRENERLIALADEFMRYKVSLIEEKVNGCFKLARFKLFDEKINGNIAECCTVTHNGVPYEDLNNAMKVNVSLDIIGAISAHYGVSVPLFCDNAESVSTWEQIPSQTIRLYVSERDTELRVEREGL